MPRCGREGKWCGGVSKPRVSKLLVALYLFAVFAAGYLGASPRSASYAIALLVVLAWTTVLCFTYLRPVTDDRRLGCVLLLATCPFSFVGLASAHFAAAVASLDDSTINRPFLSADSQAAFWSSPLTVVPVMITVGLLLVSASMAKVTDAPHTGEAL